MSRPAAVGALVSGVLVTATAASLASVAYLNTILAAAALPSRPYAGSDTTTAPDLRIAVLVPAHNEAGGIARTLSALIAQDYPDLHRRIIVIADNCADDTATIAEDLGVEVWSRVDPANRGKGHALVWALERIRNGSSQVDVIAIVDADCEASDGFLREVARAVSEGATAVQVAYRVGNAAESAESGLRSAGFALMHDIRAAGKTRLGLSAGLFGTGMAFIAPILYEIPWNSAAVTEDTDFHLRLVKAGHVVRYVSSAEVRSDMPTTAEAAADQHLRWEGGNAAVARNETARLLVSGARQLDPQQVHVALERLVPPQSLQVVLSLTALVGSLLQRRPRRAAWATVALAGQAAYVLIGLRVVGAPRETWVALAHAPGLARRRLSLAVRIARRGGPTEWTRTDRSRA